MIIRKNPEKIRKNPEKIRKPTKIPENKIKEVDNPFCEDLFDDNPEKS